MQKVTFPTHNPVLLSDITKPSVRNISIQAKGDLYLPRNHAGRRPALILLQGLGGGGLTVGLYVVVGVVFPTALQPALFASFAAAWVASSPAPSSRACTTSWSAWRSQALARAARRSAAGASRRPCARAWQ